MLFRRHLFGFFVQIFQTLTKENVMSMTAHALQTKGIFHGINYGNVVAYMNTTITTSEIFYLKIRPNNYHNHVGKKSRNSKDGFVF